jgi:hypothetical protein
MTRLFFVGCMAMQEGTSSALTNVFPVTSVDVSTTLDPKVDIFAIL